MKTIRMKKEDWQKWDTALRSGKYEQCRNSLKHDNGFCCLGVLQHVLDGDVERGTGGTPEVLPSTEWLEKKGIKFEGPYGGCRHPTLSSLGFTAGEANDAVFAETSEHRFKFPAIADAIAEAVEFNDA